jgi:hypothetical protein
VLAVARESRDAGTDARFVSIDLWVRTNPLDVSNKPSRALTGDRLSFVSALLLVRGSRHVVVATNASKADAALLDDGVADTLASGNSYQPSCFPLEARQRPCRPDRDEFGRQRELPRVRVLASLTKRGLSAAARSHAFDMSIAVLG